MGKKCVGLPEERVIVLWAPSFLFGAKLPAWNNAVEQFRQCSVGTGKDKEACGEERRPDTDPSGHTDIYDPGGAQPRGERTHFAKSGAGTVEY